MDLMDQSLLDFWKSLNHFGVKYIIVGDVAVNLHGYSRTTKYIDVWIKDTRDNRKLLGLAFSQFGNDEIDSEEFQFIPGWTDFYIGSGIVLNILVEMIGFEGYTFDECLKMSSIA